jgi:hypothetical protein
MENFKALLYLPKMKFFLEKPFAHFLFYYCIMCILTMFSWSA